MPEDLAKRVTLSNQFGMTISIITFPYILIFSFMGAPLMGALVAFVVLGYAIIPLANYFGHYTFSRLSPVVTGGRNC